MDKRVLMAARSLEMEVATGGPAAGELLDGKASVYGSLGCWLLEQLARHRKREARRKRAARDAARARKRAARQLSLPHVPTIGLEIVQASVAGIGVGGTGLTK